MHFVVLYGIRLNKLVYLWYAIGIHAAIDFVAAMYQVNLIPIWVA